MTDHPFELGATITLTEDWTPKIEKRFCTDRMWDALGCGSDPEVIAAKERYEGLVEEKHAILGRGIGPKKEYQFGWGDNVVTKILAAEAGPGDKRRIKEIDREFPAVHEKMYISSATLPAGTELLIALVSPIPNFDEGVVRVTVTATDHPGLQFKKDGGPLSNGKRSFVLRGAEFRKAKFLVEKLSDGTTRR